jgi:hypothetical protein
MFLLEPLKGPRSIEFGSRHGNIDEDTRFTFARTRNNARLAWMWRLNSLGTLASLTVAGLIRTMTLRSEIASMMHCLGCGQDFRRAWLLCRLSSSPVH